MVAEASSGSGAHVPLNVCTVTDIRSIIIIYIIMYRGRNIVQVVEVVPECVISDDNILQ